MILDLQTMFSGTVAADGTKSAQAITATAISTNVLDARTLAFPALADEGISGPDTWLMVQVIQAFNTLTSLTITFESDSAITLASSPVVHASTGAIALASLTANTMVARLMLPAAAYKRYVGLRYTVTGSNPSQGSVLAYLSTETQRNLIYPSRVTFDV
jgi:hypothetical protein